MNPLAMYFREFGLRRQHKYHGAKSGGGIETTEPLRSGHIVVVNSQVIPAARDGFLRVTGLAEHVDFHAVRLQRAADNAQGICIVGENKSRKAFHRSNILSEYI